MKGFKQKTNTISCKFQSTSSLSWKKVISESHHLQNPISFNPHPAVKLDERYYSSNSRIARVISIHIQLRSWMKVGAVIIAALSQPFQSTSSLSWMKSLRCCYLTCSDGVSIHIQLLSWMKVGMQRLIPLLPTSFNPHPA